MAGHMGQETVTTLNLTIWKVDADRGLILVKGAVPGTEGSYVKIRDAVKAKAPKDLPFPGAFRRSGEEAAPAVEEAPAEAPVEEVAAEEVAETPVTEAPVEAAAEETAAPEAAAPEEGAEEAAPSEGDEKQ